MSASYDAALLGAVRKGSVSRVQFWIKEGADVNAVTSTGMTPLLSAVRARRPEIITVLVEAGADLNLVNRKTDATPLMEAILSGYTQVVRLLLALRASPFMVDGNNATPLHWAAATGEIEIIEHLIKAGANVNARDAAKSTPLFWGISFPEAVRLLLANGADVSLRTLKGGTILHVVATRGDAASIKILCDLGIDTELTDQKGRTALRKAVRPHNNEKILMTLLECGANPYATDLKGDTPMDVALKKGLLQEYYLLQEEIKPKKLR